MKELLLRSLSGAIYVGLIILFTQYLPISILLIVFAILANTELFKLFDLPQESSFKNLFFVGTIVSLLPISLLEIYSNYPSSFAFLGDIVGKIKAQKVFAFLPFALVINMIYLMGRRSNKRGWALPFIYLSLPVLLAIDLQITWTKKLDFSPVLLLFILLWCSDTFAYITGRLFGKTKIAPSISPGKTWEGAIGGTLFTSVAAYFIYKQLLHDVIAIIPFFVGVLLIIIAGILGDLLESKLKRTKGLKDSGSIMPGHGGILDRLDSFLLAMPTAYLYFGLII